MRKFPVAILAAALCAAVMCTALPAFAARPMPQGEQPAMPVLPGPLSHKVMEAYMAYMNGNIDGIVDLTADDVEWVGIGPEKYGSPFGTFHGHAGVRQWFAGLAADAAQYSLTNLEFHEDASTVWVTGQQSTTLKNGNPESSPFAHFFKFRNGKIVAYWNLLDSATLLEAAGRLCTAPMDMPMPMRGQAMQPMDMQVGMHHGMGQMGMAGPDASAANIAVLQAGYDAFAHGDLDRLLTYFADDIQWDAVGPAGVLPIFGKFHGKDQVKQWFMTVGATMEPEPFRDVHFMGEGDTVIAWGMSRATFRATGKVVDTPFIHVAKFQDGKIVWYQCFEDTAADVMAAK